VLVRIRACAFNRIDVWGRKGRPRFEVLGLKRGDASAHRYLEHGKPFGSVVLEV
jgi:NADPH:quinone reductase-like Zn-dependent oxidoreductase